MEQGGTVPEIFGIKMLEAVSYQPTNRIFFISFSIQKLFPIMFGLLIAFKERSSQSS
jgi:hypothetical protein